MKIFHTHNFDKEKNRFVLIHALMPHGFAISKYDALVLIQLFLDTSRAKKIWFS